MSVGRTVLGLAYDRRSCFFLYLLVIYSFIISSFFTGIVLVYMRFVCFVFRESAPRSGVYKRFALYKYFIIIILLLLLLLVIIKMLSLMFDRRSFIQRKAREVMRLPVEELYPRGFTMTARNTS